MKILTLIKMNIAKKKLKKLNNSFKTALVAREMYLNVLLQFVKAQGIAIVMLIINNKKIMKNLNTNKKNKKNMRIFIMIIKKCMKWKNFINIYNNPRLLIEK